jgi:replicative DNA helicase
LDGSALSGDAELAGEHRGNGYPNRAVNLGRSTVLSTGPYQAEYALLGCVLIDDFEVWGELEEYPLDAEDFFLPEHKAIWRAMRWLCEQGMEVTIPSTVYALQKTGTLDAVDNWLGKHSYPGAATYLVELSSASFSAKGCGAFIRMVKHYSDLRAPLSHSKWEIEID